MIKYDATTLKEAIKVLNVNLQIDDLALSLALEQLEKLIPENEFCEFCQYLENSI